MPASQLSWLSLVLKFTCCCSGVADASSPPPHRWLGRRDKQTPHVSLCYGGSPTLPPPYRSP